MVFERLESYGLKANLDKCEFFQDRISYCGHEKDAQGSHKSSEKLRAQIKDMICSEKVLCHFDPSLRMKVACDASPYGIECVLTHVCPDNTERPIAFATQTLNKAEKGYSQINKEALALYWGVRKFNTYLYGHRFTLVTDHKPLLGIFNPSKALPVMTAVRLQRYAVFLSSYQYDIEYKSSKKHLNADALLRLPLAEVDTFEGDSDPVDIFYTTHWEGIPVSCPFKGAMFLIVVDAYSKWPEVFHMQSTTSTATINQLKTFFARQGIPVELVSDNSPQFRSEKFKQFTTANAICHTTSAQFHPRTNGLAERFVQTFKLGQTVITLNYRIGGNKWVHGQIHSQTGPLSYKVDVDGTLWRRHLDQLTSADISSAAPQNSTIPEMSTPAFISGGSRNAGMGESEASNKKATPAVSSPEKTPAVSSPEKTLTSFRTPPVTAVLWQQSVGIRRESGRLQIG
ncbi:PREDICTED: uncharacterized protein LOC106804796 [Priapulus caudatus]|uniref:Uncharacterized protein LOC106804796 n=1 Tax=Priapulus caudatus TaxID=37621 RepID=A0ABM1DNV8_PRICU|nr:PREDICTED: uncharacterized protein LOC106804796 [Priapulus caudatus]